MVLIPLALVSASNNDGLHNNAIELLFFPVVAGKNTE
jgi:hypothetical protein